MKRSICSRKFIKKKVIGYHKFTIKFLLYWLQETENREKIIFFLNFYKKKKMLSVIENLP